MTADGFNPSIHEYNFEIDGRVVTDPEAKLVRRTENGYRCALPAGTFRWGEQEKRPLLAYDDIVAYGLHVRGFTMHPASGVRKKGTYRGIEEKIPYLLGLAMTDAKKGLPTFVDTYGVIDLDNIDLTKNVESLTMSELVKAKHILPDKVEKPQKTTQKRSKKASKATEQKTKKTRSNRKNDKNNEK